MAKDVLGRGLGSLLPDDMEDEEKKLADGEYILCDIDHIRPNPYQPRKEMDEEALQELTLSIEQKGILQPLVVTEDTDSSELRYILIAGERRLRASRLAGLAEVPVIVRDIADNQNRLELALIENIQRQNLNPLEEALAYKQLIHEFALTQEEVAKQVGKERSTVTNTMRLLNLPDFAKDDMAAGRLSMGHARVLLALDNEQDIREIRDKIIRQGLSVRKAEELVSTKKKQGKENNEQGRKQPANHKPIPNSYCRTLSNDLIRHLGTKAKIVQSGDRGKIEIEYYSLDDLERIHDLISTIEPR